MKLLIVTQKVDKNDDNLGFFHRWIKEFAKHCEKVVVIAGSAGEYSLPANVSVEPLGRDKIWIAQTSRSRVGSAIFESLRRVRRIWKFWEIFSHHYAHSDATLFHMIPEFVVAASPFLISLRKPTALWYVHKSVTRKLKWAERLVDWIFTASELSFRLPSKKVVYTGHAIDTAMFTPNRVSAERNPLRSSALRMLTVGRISPVKDLETVLRAYVILKKIFPREVVLSIVGGPAMPRDIEYLETLKKFVAENDLADRVFFYGARPYTEIPEIYQDHDIFISMSTTGSIDKAVLEAMASGLSVITSNEAFRSILPGKYFLEKRTPELLAAKIQILADENRPNLLLRQEVLARHNLAGTIQKVLNFLAKRP